MLGRGHVKITAHVLYKVNYVSFRATFRVNGIPLGPKDAVKRHLIVFLWSTNIFLRICSHDSYSRWDMNMHGKAYQEVESQ